ncbi:MAG: hypothetical protein WKF34_00820 [Pyrinomonadaceae bacterium]
MRYTKGRVVFALVIALLLGSHSWAQTSAAAVVLGSNTAKNGFKNEDEIRDKFNAWRTDADARGWLAAMGYDIGGVESVVARKPHGEKADVEVRIKFFPQSRQDANVLREMREGISIKLVSSPNGFNQIDKRWLATYAKKWRMPSEVQSALKLFVGEVPPTVKGRHPKRMYLNEFDAVTQKSVIDFFAANRAEIVSDLFAGDGVHAAGWMMVAFKATEKTRWIIKTDDEAIKFFGDGKIEITRAGNLKIGRITMQRKGGDGGRETAKMLQFKINPVLLFDAK